MKNKIKFVSFFDKKLIRAFLIHYISLLKHYNSQEFEYYIGIDKETYIKYKNFFIKNGIHIKIIDNQLKKEFYNHKSIREDISYFTHARNVLFHIFPELEEMKGIVYLDPDTIINNKINKNYLFDNNNYAFVDEISNFPDLLNKVSEQFKEYFKSNQEIGDIFLKLLNEGKAFNAGVLIINNTEKMKRLLSRILKKKVFIDDQTLLNVFNSDEINVVDDNTQNNLIKLNYNPNASIFHFAGPKKPWMIVEDSKQLLKIYEKSGYFKYEKNLELILPENLNEISYDYKEITIILTFYDFNKNEFDYWFEIYKKLKKDGVKFSWIIDNPLIKENFKEIDSNDLFCNEKNISKLSSVIKHLKNGNVRTKYFKIFDPDDYIIIENFKNIILPRNEKIVITKLAKIFSKIEDANSEKIKKVYDNLDLEYYNFYGNPITILPTKGIQYDKYYNEDNYCNFGEDNILGTICNINGYENYFINDPILLYIWENGVTRLSKWEDNLINNFNSLKIWEMLLIKSNMKSTTDYPYLYIDSIRIRKENYEKNIKKISNESEEIVQKIENEFEYLRPKRKISSIRKKD